MIEFERFAAITLFARKQFHPNGGRGAIRLESMNCLVFSSSNSLQRSTQ